MVPIAAGTILIAAGMIHPGQKNLSRKNGGGPVKLTVELNTDCVIYWDFTFILN
jgi:hypothetical protein